MVYNAGNISSFTTRFEHGLILAPRSKRRPWHDLVYSVDLDLINVRRLADAVPRWLFSDSKMRDL